MMQFCEGCLGISSVIGDQKPLVFSRLIKPVSKFTFIVIKDELG